ncbi:MAG: type II secretion system GspH family protein [Patescibacteria group bacterium]|nr:type II secretion system GspH family protein [Patescibacteria group bacterium]
MKKQIGFTLVELIIVLAIISTLVAILITVIKPQQIFMNMRDTQRKSDLNTLSRAIDLYVTDITTRGDEIVLTPSGTVNTLGGTLTNFNHGCLGSGATPTIFYSSANVGGTTTGFTGARATNSRSIATSSTANPPGWLPVPLGTSTSLNLSNLPVDPRNSLNSNSAPSFYYTFACRFSDLSYELNANLENPNNTDEANDNGNNPFLYEIGPDKTILPSATSAHFYPNL